MLAQSKWTNAAAMACPAECLKEGPYCAVTMRKVQYYVQALWHSGGEFEHDTSSQCVKMGAGSSSGDSNLNDESIYSLQGFTGNYSLPVLIFGVVLAIGVSVCLVGSLAIAIGDHKKGHGHHGEDHEHGDPYDMHPDVLDAHLEANPDSSAHEAVGRRSIARQEELGAASAALHEHYESGQAHENMMN